MSDDADLPPFERRLFCNRTLNLRSVRAVGFDMDYTLIHYKTEEWERRAYEHARRRLADRGWPVGDLRFDPDLVTLGLVIDVELGNVVKPNRFGFVKAACHGPRMLGFDELRSTYSRVPVDLARPRWVPMQTLFALSEATLYLQLVELLDQNAIDEVLGYSELYGVVRSNLDAVHVEGELKAEIVADPDRFVDLDEELPLALLDLAHAGKSLLLVTNSEWGYTRRIMSIAFDRFLPGTWRDLFDVVIVQARKPGFFSGNAPAFRVVNEEGLLESHVGPLARGDAYVGGNADMIERWLDAPGEDILYFGDHVYSDVEVSKSVNRWRTALVVRELEAELRAVDGFRGSQRQLSDMMAQKERLEHRYAKLRLELQRADAGYGPQPERSTRAAKSAVAQLRAELVTLDERIGPLAQAAGRLGSERWGPLMRAGNDKSLFARQIEANADVYTSRVSNLGHATPYAYLRSPRTPLPHDEEISS